MTANSRHAIPVPLNRRRPGRRWFLCVILLATTNVHDKIRAINAASSSAIVPAGQSVLSLDDPQVVRVVLHPRGIISNGVSIRSWLRFHSRLPALALPDGDDQRARVELASYAGDVFCVTRQQIRRRGRNARLMVSVVEVPGPRFDGSFAPCVRLAGIDRPVYLLAHMSGNAAEQFLQHLDMLETHGLDLAVLPSRYWSRLGAAVEVGRPANELPWPGDGREEKP